MTSLDELILEVSRDSDVQKAAQAVREEPELLIVAAEVPRLAVAARFTADNLPDQYEKVEALFRDRASRQAAVIDGTTYGVLFATMAPHFKDFSFSENRGRIRQLPEVGPWLDALEVPEEKTEELWRFVDANVLEVVGDLSSRGKTNLLRFFERNMPYGYAKGPDWQHLSPWSWPNFVGDIFLAGAAVTGTVGGVILASGNPLGLVVIGTSGLLFLAGQSIKNGFDKQEPAP